MIEPANTTELDDAIKSLINGRLEVNLKDVIEKDINEKMNFVTEQID